MTKIYVDSSVLVAILFNETGADFYRDQLNHAECISSYLMEAEVYASAAREKIAFEEADALLKYIHPVIPERSLRDEYKNIFSHGYCRGGDACHIATLLYIDSTQSEVPLLTMDERQAEVARSVGISVVSKETE